MKKKLFALFCAAALLVSAIPSALALQGEQTRATDTLATLGLVRGTGQADNYALASPATRGAAVTLLVRLAGAESAAAKSTWSAGFRDVPASLLPAVNYAAQQGWALGVTAQAFQPSQTVTANAWCTFLLRMLGYSDKAGDFTVSEAAVFARHIGLTSLEYSGLLTRGDLFEIAKGALTFHYKDSEDTVISRLTAKGVVSQAAANALGLLTEELTARQIADRCTAAVFQMTSYETQEEVNDQTPSSNASGFFVDADGLAVTNYHSIADSIYSTITLVTGEQYPVERVLYYDAGIDIAVIRISKTSLTGKATSAFAALEMAGTGDIRTGDTVYTLGNPLGLGLSVSSGIISDTSRVVERYDLPCIMDTANISQGSSGGALLNAYGQVIGVTSGAYVYGNGMYLAVPVDPAMTADLTGSGWTLAEVTAIEQAKETADA